MEFLISEEYDGRTVKEYLFSVLALSRAQVTALKKHEKGIAVNGERCTVRRLLHTADKLRLALEDDRSSDELIPFDHPLDVLFEDRDLIALNKPPFMPAHPSRGHRGDTLADALAALFQKRGEPLVFRAVNRLDRDTSGVLLAAKNKRTAALLSEQIAARTVEKRYIALLDGVLETDEGVIDRRIMRAEKSIILRRTDDALGERALTNYKVLARKNGHTLVLAEPYTGRTHQLRVHFAYIGHPVTGDTLYGSPSPYIARQALHAYSLTFTHPYTGARVKIAAPLPEDMKTLLEENGFEELSFEDQKSDRRE